MARPRDYGDQFPSDTGDPTLTNPIDSLEERDYSVLSQPNDIQLSAAQRTFNPSIPIQVPIPNRRDTFGGLISSYLGFTDFYHEYSVFRSDGLLIVARHVAAHDAPEFQEAAPVIVSRNHDTDGTYLILSEPDDVEPTRYWAKLTEDLGAGSLANPTTAKADLYYYSADVNKFITDNQEVDVINATATEFDEDQDVLVRYLAGYHLDTDVPRARFEVVQIGKPLSDSGIGELITQVTTATFDVGILTYGWGKMYLLQEDPNNDQSDPENQTDEVVSEGGTSDEHYIYNSVPEAIPSGKLIQWKMINGRRVIDVDPCEDF